MFRFLKKDVKILSIDGGGIRGIIPALLLEELDRRIAARNKKRPLCGVFDLIAGTSTGSIIALGLTAPAFKKSTGRYFEKGVEHREYSRDPLFTPGDIVDIYSDHGLEIFPRHIFNQLTTARQAFTEKYNSGRFYELLEEYMGKRTLQDALTNVLVTSYDITHNTPLIMKKRPESMNRRELDPNFFLKDAIAGSSAAPTYFEPVQVSSVDGKSSHLLVDGSVFAKNPAMCALVEAQKIFPRARHFTIISLGTGETGYPYTYAQMHSWGFLEWVLPSKGVPLASIMNDGQTKCVNYQLQYLPRVSYHRLEARLGECSRSMDDAAPENMKCLRKTALSLIRENDTLLDRLARILV